MPPPGSSSTALPSGRGSPHGESTLALAGVVLVGLSIGVGTSYPLVGAFAILGLIVAGSLRTGVDLARIAVLGLVGNIGLSLGPILTDRYGAPSATKPIMVLMLALIAYDMLRRWRLPEMSMAGLGALLLFVAASGASVVVAYRTEVALPGFVDLVKSALVAIALAALLSSRDILRQASIVVLATLALLAAIGVYQGVTGHYDVDLWGLAGAQVMHIAGELDSYRICGPFGDPNLYARILVLAVPLALLELYRSPWLAGRVLAGVALAALLGAIAFSFSRGGIVAAIVPLTLMALRMRTDWRGVLTLSAICAIVLLVLAPPTLWDRIGAVFGIAGETTSRGSVEDASVDNRLDEMWVAIVMFLQNPILGVGLDNYPELFQRYTLETAAVLRHEDREAHSLFLEIAAEQGLLGSVAFAFLLLVVGHGVWRTAQDPTLAVADRDLAFAIGVAIIGYLGASAFLHDAFAEYFWLFIGMALAVPVALRSE